MAITLDGTNGIAAANVFGRNVIINGDGRLNQRGYTSGTATTSAGQYTLDRWKVVTSGQNLTFTGDDSRRVMTAPAGGVEQVIEDKNIVGGTYVISWDGTATATVNGSAVSKGGTFNLPANTHATVRFLGGTFTDVQVEAGSIATPFERRPYGTELALCQRYYFRTTPGVANKVLAPAGALLNTVSGVFNVIFPVEMRAEPTSLDQSGVANQYAMVNASGNNTCTAVPILNTNLTTRTIGGVTGTTAGASAGAGTMRTDTTNGATAFLGWSAEL